MAEKTVSWLLAVANKRSREDFAKLYEHFAPRLKAYMMRNGADAATADDLAQEALAQVWRKADRYDPSKAAASSWIFRVARNLQIDKFRKKKFQEVDLEAVAERPDVGIDSHDRSIARIDSQRVHELIQSLPQDQLDVVHLAFFQGLTHTEIGIHLDIPLGTVKSRLRLAFNRLRQTIGDQS